MNISTDKQQTFSVSPIKQVHAVIFLKHLLIIQTTNIIVLLYFSR